MALNYTSVDLRGSVVETILEEVFFANKTVGKGYVTFNDNIKAGTIFTEAGVNVTAQLYTGQALSSSGSIDITDKYITPIKLEYKQTFLEEALRASRFNRDMAAGAWQIESDEFNSKVLAMMGPACSEDAERQFWAGVTSAGKTNIAATTGLTSTSRAKIAALTAGNIDGVISKVLYDGAIGAAIQVTATTVTAANCAAEYAKIYAAIPAENLEDMVSPVVMYAPRAHKQLMKIANNSVGAAQQINFLFEGTGSDERCFYNGVEVYFVPISGDFVYAQRPAAVSWNTDLLDDVSRFETGKVANDGDLKFVRTIYTLAANVGQASKGVIYG